MNQKELNLHQLYRGYILSFNSLNIQIEKNNRNRPLFTHKIISYWKNVGLSLGFYPWSEENKRDLGWYSSDNECILHLETENNPGRVEHTIKKLSDSDEEYKIGIIFIVNESFSENELKKTIKRINHGKSLVITTWWNQESDHIESGKLQQYCYPVTGHFVTGGNVENLSRATCVWEKYGALRMVFETEPNW